MEKSSLTVLFGFLLAINVMSQANNPREMEVTEGDRTFILKQYVFCLYLSGNKRDQSEEESAKIQSAHLAHLGSLEESHHLVIAGPFGDDTEKRGILIFDLESTSDAEAAMAADPAVKAGRLSYECHPWWGAKGSELK